MRARSWMAALALVVGTSIAVGRAMPALVDEPDLRERHKPTTTTPRKSNRSPRAADPKPAGTRDSVDSAQSGRSPGWGRTAAKFRSSLAMRAASSARSTRSEAKTVSSFASDGKSQRRAS